MTIAVIGAGAFGTALACALADACTEVDGGMTLVWEAAWIRSAGKSVTRLAPMAKLFASQTYRDMTAMCVQVFGGVGLVLILTGVRKMLEPPAGPQER